MCKIIENMREESEKVGLSKRWSNLLKMESYRLPMQLNVQI